MVVDINKRAKLGVRRGHVIVCHCHAVSHRVIDRVIAEGCTSTREVGRACGAGTDCGSCLPEIRRRVAESRLQTGGAPMAERLAAK